MADYFFSEVQEDKFYWHVVLAIRCYMAILSNKKGLSRIYQTWDLAFGNVVFLIYGNGGV